MPFFRWSERRNKHALYSRFATAGDLVFDIGAHMGEVAEVFLSIGAKVLCVEPNPHCLNVLRERFGGDSRATILAEGVGETKGTLEFFVCESDSSVSTFDAWWRQRNQSQRQWAEAAAVPVTTLDALIEEFGVPEYCSIDVEGFEAKVLRGLRQRIHYVSFEFTQALLDDARTCLDHLSSLGKPKCNFSVYSYFRLCSSAWLDPAPLLERIASIHDEGLTGDIFVELE